MADGGKGGMDWQAKTEGSVVFGKAGLLAELWPGLGTKCPILHAE
jgi:hypothetical protein